MLSVLCLILVLIYLYRNHLYNKLDRNKLSHSSYYDVTYGGNLDIDENFYGDQDFNIEEFDPDPFMDMLNQYGLPWVVDENPQTVE